MFNRQIGAFETKTRFSQIIKKVGHCANFIVTKRGKPVAKIISFKQEPEMTFEKAVAKLQEIRKF
jgi:prevent-host-death family protein